MALSTPPSTGVGAAPARACRVGRVGRPHRPTNGARALVRRMARAFGAVVRGSFVEREGFPEVEGEVLESRWRVVRMGMSRFDESNTVKEARVAVWALEHELRGARAHGRRSLRLVDNFGAVLSLSRGRSHNLALLQLCRRVAALSLATGSRPPLALDPERAEPRR